MARRNIVVIGASAGGIEALSQVISRMPPDFPGAVAVVVHVASAATSVLPRILNRLGTLPATHPRRVQTLQPGRIYVAPPDRHLLVTPGAIRLSQGPRENGHRPAVDVLFRTAAVAYGPRVVGVVLSGVLDDGTAGLHAIARMGGVAVVQEPSDALYSGMPNSAIEAVAVDHVLPAAKIAELLGELVHEDVEFTGGPMQEIDPGAPLSEFDKVLLQASEEPGTPSGYVCPECNGALWEVSEGEIVRYRCRVGHAYSPDTFMAKQAESVEAALWTALRALEERIGLSHRLEERARQRGQERIADRFRMQASDASARADVLRAALLNGGSGTVETNGEPAEEESPETGELTKRG